MNAIYDEQFFRDHKEGARSSAEVIIPRVLKLCSPKAIRSVVDVGCGLGSWLRVFGERGATDVLGIDGDYVDCSGLEIPDTCFLSHNLDVPLYLPRNFDLAISVEVAEHLPPVSAEQFVQTLTRLAPVILFSAAIPGQGGEHHINEQWPDYWAELFKKYHYVGVDCLRLGLLGDLRVEFWYQQNVFLFVASKSLAEYPELDREYRRTEGRTVSLVHPNLLERWKHWGMSQYEAYWELAAQDPGKILG